MSFSSWELAARFNSIVFANNWVVKESATRWGVWLYVPPAGALPVRVLGPFVISAGARFPYGIDVLPD